MNRCVLRHGGVEASEQLPTGGLGHRNRDDEVGSKAVELDPTVAGFGSPPSKYSSAFWMLSLSGSALPRAFPPLKPLPLIHELMKPC